ncbi:GGDEF domain-containing protein [Paenibacillus eucommiae]|uniref:EAL domain-containing protein (Putative c-di-GMP-specific phosphodiesterase class I)/GGDEF domain-containing protein n=1 Tax=Paenibacillus eucommiae TaxID=1355755 RepID=A0ABS4IPH8_9BACL|nr:GGDEF domain-containing protein [Paenibacillus eucommiae]MBP1989420.1 EAL domain-containing protein (putative c-di-GMP-specific phosphodiesterase class I)/GGDEF domain-containing protein [Paenibacillus eucommiae]
MNPERHIREPNSSISEKLSTEFRRIIEQHAIYCVYQPIVSLQDGAVYGYEALTRGPRNSIFHSPMELFKYAEKTGTLYALDKMAREKAIQGSILDHDQQLLFINISSEVIYDPQFIPGKTLEILQKYGLDPRNVVFEITERSSIEDFALAKKILEHYRKQGYRIAIDDAGAGYSSLQAIAELHPDFVKIDRSLIQDIHTNKIKEYILETFVTFAQKMNIQLIAEGIEHRDELTKLTRMGIHYAQGYLLGKPELHPASISEDQRGLILEYRKLHSGGTSWSIGDLVTPIQMFDRKAIISEVANYFKINVDAVGAVIVSDDVPVGLIMREHLFRQLSAQYGFSLFWNRTIDHVMDEFPLIVDEQMAVELVSQMATSRSIQNLYDLVIITSSNKMAGVASIRTILESITNVRMETARVANPLTGLPGNLQINRDLHKRLKEQKTFSVIYADLDYFKWYNDRFGFQKGDQLIQFTADILQQAIAVCGSLYDFVGHVGGDDFIAISMIPNPELLCQEMIRRFEQGVHRFYGGEDWDYIEDRSGNRIQSEGVTLSLSLVVCQCESPVSLEQISYASAILKKKAKAYNGSVYFSHHIGAAGAAI